MFCLFTLNDIIIYLHWNYSGIKVVDVNKIKRVLTADKVKQRWTNINQGESLVKVHRVVKSLLGLHALNLK